MTQKEKLLNHLCSLPKDFTINQLEGLMKSLGYIEYRRGKTLRFENCILPREKETDT